MRPEAASSLMVRQFLVLKIHDTKHPIAYYDVNGKVCPLFWTKERVPTETLRMGTRYLRARCTRIATMLRPLPISVVRRNRMEALTISPIAAGGAK